MSDEKTSTNYNDQFNKYLNKLTLLKKQYEDKINNGGLSKEKNKQYKENLITLYPHIEKKYMWCWNSQMLTFQCFRSEKSRARVKQKYYTGICYCQSQVYHCERSKTMVTKAALVNT